MQHANRRGKKFGPFSGLAVLLLTAATARMPVQADNQNQTAPNGKASDGKSARSTGGSKKDADSEVIVLTPEGTPAASAKVGIDIAPRQILVVNGEITSLIEHTTDVAGRFHWLRRPEDFTTVITHRSGFAHLQCRIQALPKTIRLAPWARVEGIYRVTGKPKSDVPIFTQSVRVENREKEAVALFLNRGTTDANGKFVFERVIPGRAIIGRRGPSYSQVRSHKANSWSRSSATFVTGKANQMDFGTSGRPVIGQLSQAPSSKPALPWNTAHVEVASVGQGAPQSFFVVEATVDDNGNFSANDVPAGQYKLSVGFGKSARGEFSSFPVTVPAINEKLSQRPIDLGVLTLEP
jgi:hypothetical protein